jgi:hypothetical protein
MAERWFFDGFEMEGNIRNCGIDKVRFHNLVVVWRILRENTLMAIAQGGDEVGGVRERRNIPCWNTRSQHYYIRNV